MPDARPSHEIAVAPQTELSIEPGQTSFNEKQIAALRMMGVTDATPADLAVFFHQAARTGLDPFAKQLYLIGRWSRDGVKYTIQTGIDGFRLVARRAADARHEDLSYDDTQWCGPDGKWQDVWLSDEYPSGAKVVVHRGSGRFPAVALWKEYAQTGRDGKPASMWQKMGVNQLAKCAEALALRKAFPQDLSGLYTTDEMAQADPDRRTVVAAPDPATVVDAIEQPITPDPPSDAGNGDAQTPAPITDEWFIDVENAAASGDLDTMRALGFQAKATKHLNALAQFRVLWPEAVKVARERDADAAEAAIAAARAAEAAQAAS
jgi:phage recombination protein Bet